MQVLHYGEHAVLVEVDPTDPDSALAAVHALDAAVSADPPPGVTDVVPGRRSVLVRVAPGTDLQGLSDRLAALRPVLLGAGAGRTLEVPVRYDGPDLAEVADLVGLGEAEVVARHTAPRYRVAMLGFLPGFPYLVGLDPVLHVPRRDTPRERVPTGSVGLAGDATGIYPVASPGGWRLIGRTDVRLLDLTAPDRPTALAPGDTVVFRAC